MSMKSQYINQYNCYMCIFVLLQVWLVPYCLKSSISWHRKSCLTAIQYTVHQKNKKIQ